MSRRADANPENHNLYQVGSTWYFKAQVKGVPVRESLRTDDVVKARKKRDLKLDEIAGKVHSWPEAVGRWLVETLGFDPSAPGARPAPASLDAATAERYRVSIGQLAPALVRTSRDERPQDRVQLDELAVERITLTTIADIVAWSKQHRRVRGKPVSNATLRRDLTALSSLLHSCIGWTWREDNPARTWDRSHIKERRDPIYLPPDEHVAAVIAASPRVWGMAIDFLDKTGMRETEGFGLRWSEIDRDARGRPKGATLTDTKGDRVRYVPFTEEVIGILIGIPRHVASEHVFWHGAAGQPYHNVASQQLRIRNSRRVKATGLKVTFALHHLRHRYAVRYLREGGSIYDLQLILGHESVKTTEIYLDFLDPVTRQRAMRRAGGSA